ESFRWTFVRQIHPETAQKTPQNPKNNLKRIIVLQKTYECPECGKNFSCGSHFAKHRRIHTG
ncbi:ZN790 protein, partial [Sterrhoptilus dennistouni]|nr:ZN790 protein [Sterrhoptilus dennistouni]